MTAGTATAVVRRIAYKVGHEGLGIDGIDMVIVGAGWKTATGPYNAFSVQPNAGDRCYLWADVKNQGTVAVPSGTILDCGMQWGGATSTWSDDYTGGLAAGATLRLICNGGDVSGQAFLDVVAGTTYSLSYLVNSGPSGTGRFTELDRSNNTAIFSVTVAAGASGPGPSGPGSPTDVQNGMKASVITMHVGLPQYTYIGPRSDMLGQMHGNPAISAGLAPDQGGGQYFVPGTPPNASPDIGGPYQYQWQWINGGYPAAIAAASKQWWFGHYLVTNLQQTSRNLSNSAFDANVDDSFMIVDPFNATNRAAYFSTSAGAYKMHQWAHSAGAQGPFLDGEPYSHANHSNAWGSLNHKKAGGGFWTGPEVKAAFYGLGQQFAAWLVSAYVATPSSPCRIAQYINSDGFIEGGWQSKVGVVASAGDPNPYVTDPNQTLGYFADWFEGVISNPAITWQYYSAIFQKGPQIGGYMDEAMRFDSLAIHQVCSKYMREPNWLNFLRNVNIANQTWPDAGQTSFERQLGEPEFTYYETSANLRGGISHNVYPQNWPATGEDPVPPNQPHSGVYSMYNPSFDAGAVVGVMNSTYPTLSWSGTTPLVRSGGGLTVNSIRGDHSNGVIGISWAHYSGGTTTPGTGTFVKEGALKHDLVIDSGNPGYDPTFVSHISTVAGHSIPTVTAGHYIDFTVRTQNLQTRTYRLIAP